MAAAFDPVAASEISEVYEFHVDWEVFHLKIRNGKMETSMGNADLPGMVLTASSGDLKSLVIGDLSVDDALSKHAVHPEQVEVEVLQRFLNIFAPNASAGDASKI